MPAVGRLWPSDDDDDDIDDDDDRYDCENEDDASRLMGCRVRLRRPDQRRPL